MQGAGRHPSLRTARMHDAADGELHWLLANAVLAQGMPSWPRLHGDRQWRLTRYSYSLPIGAPK